MKSSLILLLFASFLYLLACLKFPYLRSSRWRQSHPIKDLLIALAMVPGAMMFASLIFPYGGKPLFDYLFFSLVCAVTHIFGQTALQNLSVAKGEQLFSSFSNRGKRGTEQRQTVIVALEVDRYLSWIHADKAGTLSMIKVDSGNLIDPKAAQYRGRVIKKMIDGGLVEFPKALNALKFAVEIQSIFKGRNMNTPPGEVFAYRIGINRGDVIIKANDVTGEGADFAVRLAKQAETGGIYISENVRRDVKDSLNLNYEDRGSADVKNAAGAVRIFSVKLDEKAEKLMTPLVQIENQSLEIPVSTKKILISLAMGFVGTIGLLLWVNW